MRRSTAAIGLLVTAGLLAGACSRTPESDERPAVEVFGNVVGDAGAELGALLRDASNGTGVQLRYVGVTSFIEQLSNRLAQGDRPGVALLNQPGVLDDLVQRGIAQPLPADVAAEVSATVPGALVNLVDVDDQLYAAWLSVDVKGLVWYRPDELGRLGHKVPATLDELATLSEAVRASGESVAPWCIDMEAGASTGWVGTDWVESYLLRRLGPDAYDRWTKGELRFDTPEVRSVFDELDRLLREPGQVAGGSRAVLTTPWQQAAPQLVATPPRCLFVHQADFLRQEFPTGITIGPEADVDFFPLPPANASGTPPALVGGRLAVALDDSPEVAEALRVLASPAVAEALTRTGRYLSPNRTVDGALTDSTSRRLLDLVEAAPVVRFDGSDLMPAAVGAGTFWGGMRSFFSGEAVSSVVAEIDAGWSDGTTGD